MMGIIKRMFLPIILLLLLILEGLALDLIPMAQLVSDYMIVAHWILIFLVYIAIYYDQEGTYYAVVYAVIFGLLIDIAYTGHLGIYMFSYSIAILFVQLFQKILYRNIFVLIFLGAIAILIADLLIYIIFTIIGITEMIWFDYLFIRMIPTLLANLLFLLLLYPFFKKKLEKWGLQLMSNHN